MTDVNSTALQTYQASVEFITIPPYFSKVASTQFSSYIPIILMDDAFDVRLGVSVSKSINLEAVATEEEALELARVSCLSMDGAIGYAVRGVEHD